MAGVTPPLQRDWRRRGIIEAKTAQGFSFRHLLKAALLKTFGDAGFSVKATALSADVALSALWYRVMRLEGMVDATAVPPETREKFPMGAVPQDKLGAWRRRFLVIRHSQENLTDLDELDVLVSTGLVNDWSEIEAFHETGALAYVDERRDWPRAYGVTVFDLESLGQRIARNAPGPIAEVHPSDDTEEPVAAITHRSDTSGNDVDG